jgi:hypothetical protein
MKKIRHLALVMGLAVAAGSMTGCLTDRGRLQQAELQEQALQAALSAAAAGGSRLTPAYIQSSVADAAADPPVAAALEAATASPSPEATAALLRAIELRFIHDPATSTLDLIPEDGGRRFREFAWDPADYPGGPEGPNELLAREMSAALSSIRPERRANSGHDPVVVRAQASDEVWAFMEAEWTPIPGDEKFMINRHAVPSYVAMREAAAAEGVELIILSAHRTRATAERNAARANNPSAVASFSSHSLGLAIDFQMSQGDRKFAEVTTRPMSDVVRMRESPVHKWMFLRGEDFGWFPFQHEPWHWEYNPVGFREVFWSTFPGGMPPVPPPAD